MKRVRGDLRAAAALADLRRRGHGRGHVQGGEAARLADDRRRRASEVRHGRAAAERRRDHRRVAGGGAGAGRARPRDGRRRPHARRQVRRAGAEGGSRVRGVLHRRARLAPQPGATPRAAARGRRRRGGARAHPGPVRPRHRRRVAARDGALDPGRGTRRPHGPRRRQAQGVEEANSCRGGRR